MRRAVVDAPVRLLDQLRDALLAAAVRVRLRIAAAARPEASSPACAPPMPSATPKSGGATTYASSLRRRLRPVSVSRRVADLHGSNLRSVSPIADDVARVSACGRASAGCRSRRCRSSSRCPRCRRRRGAARSARGASRRTRRRAAARRCCAAADGQRMRLEGVRVALVERGAREHDETAELARGRLRDQAGGGGLLRREDHRLLRQPQVARRRADDPPDEEVEQDEERDLQEEERRLDLGRASIIRRAPGRR